MDSQQQLAIAKLAAKRQIGMLRTEINYQVSHGKANKQDLEQAHSRLQQEISRTRFVLRRLSTCLEVFGGENPSDCPQVTTLQTLLEAAVIERSKLYVMIFGNQKRDSLKAFTQSILDMIARGQSASWISRVTREELINHGQEINRLYQLLYEGHGSVAGGIPLVDSLTLARASERIDLFTTKQCECLRKRSSQVDELMLKQVDLLVRNLQEDEVNQLVLPSVPDRNDVASTSGWTCEKCTFVNEDHTACCGACGTPQDNSFVAVAKRNANKPIPKVAQVTAGDKVPKSVVIKKLPSRRSSTNTVWIRNEDVPEFIGPRGKNQKALIKQTGAKSIYAFQDRLDKDGMCPIEIEGSLEAFEKTVEVLEKKFGSKTHCAANGHINSSNDLVTKNERIWIRNSDVPEMIGPCGKTVKAFKARTGVKSITAWQELVDEEGLCPIDIRGHPEAVKMAATTIMTMFCGIPDASHRGGADLEEPAPLESTRLHTGKANTELGASSAIRAVPSDSIGMKTFMSSLPHIPVAQMPVSRSSTEDNRTTAPDPLLHPPPTALPSLTAELKSALGVTNSDAETGSTSSLLYFLQDNKSCLTCSPRDFCDWLESVQIFDPEEFAEALGDDDFVRLEMKANGLKYFKRFTLQTRLTQCLAASAPHSTLDDNDTADPPSELVCPIRHILMVNDPVLAPDGYTYEREAIMEWLDRGGDTALSPMTHEPLGSNAALVSNIVIRTMARDWHAKMAVIEQAERS
jgi:hypothetical protein